MVTGLSGTPNHPAPSGGTALCINAYLDTRALGLTPSEDRSAHFCDPCVDIPYVVIPASIDDGTPARQNGHHLIQRHRHRSRTYDTSTTGYPFALEWTLACELPDIPSPISRIMFRNR
jgi:hypothetical protein